MASGWMADRMRSFRFLLAVRFTVVMTGAVAAVAWRSDSNVLASAGEDGTVQLWEMFNGKQVKRWNAHGGGVLSVAFSQGGDLVTSGRDRTVKTNSG